MTYNEIRKLFLNYFESHGHTIVPSVSLLPENDPTLLFTVAGMVPWKGMLEGTEELKYGPRVADVQKCIRAGGKHNDLDEVGFDGRHHTFFEMLGNWSFGDYFKQGAIEMSWELLTKVIGLDPEKIRVTTHISDDEATAIWKQVANKDAIRLGDKDNWWAAGDTGPCGPCTEMFYDMGADIENEDDRWVEIWNDVFMQYNRDANGNLTPLPKQNVDTGAGLERWAAILQGVRDNYETDLFVNLMRAVEEITGTKRTPENTPSFKVIADHMRAVGFAIADGIIPSNSDRGYVIRRILRRAMRHGQMLGHRGPLLSKLYPTLITEMGEWYPELSKNKEMVIETIRNEEHSFADMLENGMKLLEKELSKVNNNVLPGDVAFKLFDTYGFPLDLTEMILRDKNISVDVAEFNKCMTEQKERSRADTKGTKTLWESKNLEATEIDNDKKYDISNNSTHLNDDSREISPAVNGVVAKIKAILKDGEFVESANTGDEVEIALDKTNFYATMGGQVGDTGTFYKFGSIIPDVEIKETFVINGVVIHKGIVKFQIKLGEQVCTNVDSDNRIKTARAHTAAHLLQAALQNVLGEYVHQKGSKVSPDSVRFDFSFGRGLTAEEIKQTEDLINKWIAENIPVETIETDIETAKSRGAMALFGEKYGDTVRMVSAGDVSVELCGGTHIINTSEIIAVKINKEKSVASGIRRITMSVGDLAK